MTRHLENTYGQRLKLDPETGVAYVSTSQPVARPGLFWANPSTGAVQWYDPSIASWREMGILPTLMTAQSVLVSIAASTPIAAKLSAGQFAGRPIGGDVGAVSNAEALAMFALGYAAKGDLFIGTGSGTGALLSVGADDTIVIADAAESTGYRAITPSDYSALLYHLDTQAQGYESASSASSIWMTGTARYVGSLATGKSATLPRDADLMAIAVIMDVNTVTGSPTADLIVYKNGVAQATLNTGTLSVGNSQLFTTEYSAGTHVWNQWDRWGAKRTRNGGSALTTDDMHFLTMWRLHPL